MKEGGGGASRVSGRGGLVGVMVIFSWGGVGRLRGIWEGVVGGKGGGGLPGI